MGVLGAERQELDQAKHTIETTKQYKEAAKEKTERDNMINDKFDTQELARKRRVLKRDGLPRIISSMGGILRDLRTHCDGDSMLKCCGRDMAIKYNSAHDWGEMIRGLAQKYMYKTADELRIWETTGRVEVKQSATKKSDVY